MPFDAPAGLPAPGEHPAYLRRVLGYLRDERRITPGEALESFLGEPADPATLGVTAIHHVAAYAGDYDREEDFDAWLGSVQSSDLVTDVRHGPSYVAPWQYGTPGHWINLVADGHEYELFTCRNSGEWARFDRARKAALMSHHAVAVDSPGQVQALLDFLAARPEIERVVYTPADEIGHCYGHLRHRKTGQVLEIVYSGQGDG